MCVSGIHDVLQKKNKDVLFVAASGPLVGRDRFNPFLVSDSAQLTVRRGFTQVLDCCILLSPFVIVTIILPVNTRKAFDFWSISFLVSSLALSIALVMVSWKHNKN